MPSPSADCVGEDDEVAVEIADPDLPMTSVGIEVDVSDDLGVDVIDPANRGVEGVDLEPDRDAVSERLLRVSNRRGAGAAARSSPH
jgi:hypothetical protein